jgi:hypothetical protein
MSFPDNVVISKVELCKLILMKIHVRVFRKQMANKRYDDSIIQRVIELLERNTPNSVRKGGAVVKKLDTKITCDFTDFKIEENIVSVLQHLDDVIKRLKIIPLSDKSHNVKNIKEAYDALIAKMDSIRMTELMNIRNINNDMDDTDDNILEMENDDVRKKNRNLKKTKKTANIESESDDNTSNTENNKPNDVTENNVGVTCTNIAINTKVQDSTEGVTCINNTNNNTNINGVTQTINSQNNTLPQTKVKTEFNGVTGTVNIAPLNYYDGRVDNLKLITSYDFRKGFDIEKFGYIFGSDGMITVDNVNGLTIDSSLFTFTIPTGNDHSKWLRLTTNLIPLNKSHEVILEEEIAVQQIIKPNTVPSEFISRIRNIKEDLRLCSGGMVVIDVYTWMVFGFMLTDECIYAYYERLPFGKPAWNDGKMSPLGNYSAFTNAVLVSSRNKSDPLNDYTRLGIGIHRGRGDVNWYINGTRVHTWSKIGVNMPEEYRLINYGGVEKNININTVRVGFGTFSFMDGSLPHNYGREGVVTINNQYNINAGHLVELEPVDRTDRYVELYSDISGSDRQLADKSITFAITGNGSTTQLSYDLNRNKKVFGQGAIIRIKYLNIYIR